MKRYFNIIFLFVLACFIGSCSSKSRFEYSVKQNEQGFEVQILKDQAVIIHQEYWPGLAGNQIISSEKSADKLAKLFVKKLEKGIFPPTITPEEIESIRFSNQ